VQTDAHTPPLGQHAQHLLEKAKEKIDKTKGILPTSPRPGTMLQNQPGPDDAELQALLAKWSEPERQQGLVPEKESGRPVWDTSHLGWQDFAKRRCGAFWMGAKAYKGYAKVEEARTKMGEDSQEYQAMREKFHNEFAKEIRVHTERAKGMYIKFCQELSTKSGVVKDVYIDEFQPLTNSTPESAPEEVLRVMRADLGVPLDEVFTDFGLRPIASASIGQVHKARLRSTGELVAVKVQHEGVDRVMMDDLKTLKKLAKMMKTLEPDTFDMTPIIQSWEETLPMELDFRQEATATADARAALAGTDVVVPTVFPDLCTKRVLIMRFLNMQPFTTLLDKKFLRSTGTDVKTLCNELVDACGVLVFKAGLLHGDPHAGNVTVMQGEDGKGVVPVLLDWGMFYKMSNDERLGMAHFYHALANIDMPGMLDALGALGLKFKGGVTKSQDFVDNFVDAIKCMGQDTMSKEERAADTKLRNDAAKSAKEQKSKSKAGKDATKAATKQVQKLLGRSWGEVTKGLSNKESTSSTCYEDEVDNMDESGDMMNPFRDIPAVVVIFMRMVLMLVGLFCTVEATGLQTLPVLAKHARQALQAASLGKEPFGYKLAETTIPSASSSRSRSLDFRLQQLLQKLALDGLIVGAQVVVLQGSEMVCDIAFGTLSSVDARPVKADTKFPVVDLSSGLMALAIARALRRKSSNAAGALNAKVSQYWPEFAGGRSAISLREVLSHTAGAQGCYPEPFGFADIDDFDKVCRHLEASAMSPTKEAHTAFLLQAFLLWKLADCIIGGSLQNLGGKGYDGAIEQELAPLGLETAWLANRGRDVHIACACRDLPPLKGGLMNGLEPPAKPSTTELAQKPRTPQECLVRSVLRNPFTFDPMQANASASGSFRAAMPLGTSARSLGKLFACKQLWDDLTAIDALRPCAMDPTATGWLLTAGACTYTGGGLQLLQLRRSGYCNSCFAGASPDPKPGYGLLSPCGSCVMHFPDLGTTGTTIAITLNDVLRGGKAASKLVTAILKEMGAAPTWTKLPLRVITDASQLSKSPEIAPIIEQMGGMASLMALAQENMDDSSWQQRLLLKATTVGRRCATLCSTPSQAG